MDDTARLRQTVRRCTSVVVATVAFTGVSLQRPSEASLLVLLAVGAVGYLAVDVFDLLPPAADASDDAADARSAGESSDDQ